MKTKTALAPVQSKARKPRAVKAKAVLAQPAPVAVMACLCRRDCPQYHKPHADAWLVTCDCGRHAPGYACGECIATGRITACVACMVEGTKALTGGK